MKDWHWYDGFVLFLEHFTPDSYKNDLRLLTELGIHMKKLRLWPDAMPTVCGHQPIRQAVLQPLAITFFLPMSGIIK